MRESTQQYIRSCDPCRRRKENPEMIPILGDVEETKIIFEVTLMEIIRPYTTTQRGNNYTLI
jgi:hypothetical protein